MSINLKRTNQSTAGSTIKPVARRSGLRGEPSGRERHRGSETRWAWLFVSPTMVGLLFFTVGPLAFAIYIGFTDWNLLGSPKWVGLANYSSLVGDPTFWETWLNTLYYTAVSVPLSMALGLGLAMLVNRSLPGMSIFQFIFFVPMTIGIVASGLLWAWMFNSQFGVLNYLLHFVGIGPVPWLTSSAMSMPAIILVGVWRALGFNVIVFLAGLQMLPRDLYEAAAIDGASAFTRFRRLTLPLLSPTTFFAALMGIILSFQVFEQTYIMTQGGPGNSTLTIIYYIFTQGFTYLKMGYASAASVTFFIVLILGTAAMLRLQNRLVHYEN